MSKQWSRDQNNSYQKRWGKAHPGYRTLMHKNYRNSNFRRYLNQKVIASRTNDKRIGRENNINVEYVLELFETQLGRCAATNLKMTHKVNDLLGLLLIG